jgi:hypothetical protein
MRLNHPPKNLASYWKAVSFIPELMRNPWSLMSALAVIESQRSVTLPEERQNYDWTFPAWRLCPDLSIFTVMPFVMNPMTAYFAGLMQKT